MRVPPVPSFWGPARKASRSGSGEQYTDGSPAPLNQTCKYTADDLSRIASVDCGNSTWAQTFSYDAFGNIQKSGTSNYIAAYSPVTNQVSGGPGYDANGNQLQLTSSIPWTSLTWNALNQPISVSSTTATYDALGRMVEKGSGGTYTQFVFRPSGAMLAVYSGGLVKGTIPLPGGSTAIYNASGVNYIRHKDWLGSSRLATTWATHAVYSKEAYAPFGETYYEIGTADRSFTGQDQNVATGSGGTGVYDYLFRKYDPSAGRWLSPDPSGWSAVNQYNPQSLDRYAYVQNNPMSLVDPNGLDACYYGDPDVVSSDTDASDWGDSTPADCKAEGGRIVVAISDVIVNGSDCRSSDPDSTDCMQANIYLNARLSLVGAPNNAPSNYPGSSYTSLFCVGDALRANGISIGFDIVGAIPGLGNLVSGSAAVARGVNAVASYGGAAYGAYSSATGKGPSAFIGAVSTSVGLSLTLAD